MPTSWGTSPNVAIHNKNGKGLLPKTVIVPASYIVAVAIHNKNGKGLLPELYTFLLDETKKVAIHNKNGKGLLPCLSYNVWLEVARSQSTIKMEKGYF